MKSGRKFHQVISVSCITEKFTLLLLQEVFDLEVLLLPIAVNFFFDFLVIDV